MSPRMLERFHPHLRRVAVAGVALVLTAVLAGGHSASALDQRAPLASVATPILPTSAPPPRVALFDGLDQVSAGRNEPSDATVAVNAGFVVETVNSAVRIWDRSGKVLLQKALGSLWGLPPSISVGDPRIVWDEPSGHWFGSIFDESRSRAYVGFGGPDPRKPWHVFFYRISGCPDLPRLGVTDGLLLLTIDHFSECDGGHWTSTLVYVMDKASLFTGNVVARSWTTKALNSATPIQGLDGLVANTPRPGQLAFVPFAKPADVGMRIQYVRVGRFADPPPVPQRGGAPIPAGEARVQSAVWDGHWIWAVLPTACAAPGGAVSCVDLVRFAPGAHRGTSRLYRLDGTRSVLYPAIMPDERGNLLVAFGFSSATDYASAGLGLIPARGGSWTYTLVKAGMAPYKGARWGDYSGLTRDPLGRAWAAIEYAGAKGWATAVAAFGPTRRAGTP